MAPDHVLTDRPIFVTTWVCLQNNPASLAVMVPEGGKDSYNQRVCKHPSPPCNHNDWLLSIVSAGSGQVCAPSSQLQYQVKKQKEMETNCILLYL